ELLIFLVARREQMVSREDIVKKLWRSDLFIDTERNVNNIVRKIRTALGDDADRPRYLETVVGKGYRFIGPVRVISAQFSRYDLEVSRLPELERDIAKQIASTLKRPLETAMAQRPRYSRDRLAYAEFMQGYRLSSSGDKALVERASQHLTTAVSRDPAFALAH